MNPCTHCRRLLPESDFPVIRKRYQDGKAFDYVTHVCWVCTNARLHRSRVNDGLKPGQPGYQDFPFIEWAALLERLDFRCVMCGWRGRVTIDHIVPISLGGQNIIENLQPLCRRCNLAKKAQIMSGINLSSIYIERHSYESVGISNL